MEEQFINNDRPKLIGAMKPG